MIDSDGFRPNIGIILTNRRGLVLWGKRIHQDAWQFPQGGMLEGETADQTLFRELKEELGLEKKQVTLLGRTRHWLRYRLPKHLIRDSLPTCIGQKQLWYLLRLEVSDVLVRLDHTPKPEFDDWAWVNYWYPLRQVIRFKREVYRRALRELAAFHFEHFRGRGEWALDPLLSQKQL